MDFDEYVSANYKRLEGQTRELVEDAFKAGQQSKQAEIDALKEKVNDALEALNDGSFNYCQKQLEELLK